MSRRAAPLIARAALAFARGRRALLLGLCGLALASASQAQRLPAQPAEPRQGSVWLAESDQALDRLRGGFDMGSGLLVSFGISRMVFINGQLVTTTSFQLGELGQLTPAQAQALGQQIAPQGQLVQNGPGNSVDAQAGPAPLATYIQNTLNNQLISSQTVIQASTSGLSLVKGLNLQSTLNDSISSAIRNR